MHEGFSVPWMFTNWPELNVGTKGAPATVRIKNCLREKRAQSLVDYKLLFAINSSKEKKRKKRAAISFASHAVIFLARIKEQRNAC